MEKLTVPSKELLPNVQKLCDLTNPYETNADTDELFVSAMKENTLWHMERNKFYRDLCASKNFTPDNLKTISDIEKMPYILANFFKKHEVKSISDDEETLHLTSSGTSGQKSQMFFDNWTISSAQRMVEWIWKHYGWITPEEPCNYLLYTYEPEEGSKLGTAFTDNFLCEFAPVNKVTYALKYMGEGKGHKFDVFGVIRALKEYEKEGLPVRIFGFPAFLHFTLKQMSDIGMEPLKLNPESMTFLGGGWKGHQEKAITKDDLYSRTTELLGIPNERCRDGFGSVEHCIPYIECEHHNFHIPVWSKVIIRDVKTLEPVKEGEVGYLNLISPYITSVPANNVLMGDLAKTNSNCPCGNKTDFFEIIGRAGVSKNRSCAVAASELLKEFK